MKEKQSSSQNIDFPKKTPFYLAQTQNLRCHYMGNHFGDQFRTSKSDLDELFPFFQKISFFLLLQEKTCPWYAKNIKMAFYHQGTLPLNIGFREKHLTDKKKSKFCLKNCFFLSSSISVPEASVMEKKLCRPWKTAYIKGLFYDTYCTGTEMELERKKTVFEAKFGLFLSVRCFSLNPILRGNVSWW